MSNAAFLNSLGVLPNSVLDVMGQGKAESAVAASRAGVVDQGDWGARDSLLLSFLPGSSPHQDYAGTWGTRNLTPYIRFSGLP